MTDYASFTNEQLLNELTTTTIALIATHRELAGVLVDEYKARVEGYFAMQDASGGAREWEAKNRSLPATIARFELEGDVAALTEQKWMLVRLLDERKPRG